MEKTITATMSTAILIAVGLMFVFTAETANVGIKGTGLTPIHRFPPVDIIDGKSFFPDHTISRNWTDARDFCKAVGMKMAHIRSPAEANYLANAYSDYFQGKYWTSARDAMTHRQFSWDGTKEEVEPFLPFSQTKPISCMVIEITHPNGTSEGHYSNADCSDMYGTMCEVVY